MSYRITKKANSDIEAICDYIARDNTDAADKMDERFHREIQQLVLFPGMGHRRSDVTNPQYRFWPVGKYVVAYRVEKGKVVVSRVLHGARNLRDLFGKT